jgi:hypothetical protein
VSAPLLEKLIDAGTPAALVAEVAMQLARAEALQQAAEQRKAKDRERKRVPRNSTESEEGAEIPEKVSLEVSPHTPLPKPFPKLAPLYPPVDLIENEWNAMAGKHGLPKISGITGNRLKAFRRRSAEHGLEAISRAIANVPKSPHWLGENGWLGNFDSLLRPDNFQRMLEGTYCAKGSGRGQAVSREQQIENLTGLISLYSRQGKHDEVREARRKLAELEAPANVVQLARQVGSRA